MSNSSHFNDKMSSAEMNSSSDTNDGVDIVDPKMITRIKRRIDFRTLPIMSLLYAVALIDRTNMGIARVAGMGSDLKLNVGDRYSIASCVYFVPYIILQLPSNLVLRKLGPRNWMSICVIGWGISQLSMGFVTNWHQLSVLRALLGLFEAGFFPAMVFIISTWYTRQEVQKRLAFFYLGSIFLSGFSMIFAYALTLLKGHGGLAGWQWIFVVMGIITVVLGLAGFFFIPHFPDQNTFLSVEHTKVVLARVEKDRGDSMPDKLTKQVIFHHLSDWTIWAHALMFMCNTMPAYAVGFFVTVILKSMGWDDVHSFILSAPPYVAAAAACFCFAWAADKTMRRAVWIAVQALITLIGTVFLGFHKSSGIRYFGIFLMNMGASSGVPAVLAYSANNVIGHSKRAVSTAMIISFGGVGGVFATTVFREKDFPAYRPGILATISCQLLLLILLLVTTWTYHSRNNDARRHGRILESQPKFMYTL
ncbi:high-affinity nicotinic acid transporter [Flagelloscypha sp. PMI_526]|nr:high-affinity nicotinic acid transporter [Flagelloscypha sp. PMI_526]